MNRKITAFARPAKCGGLGASGFAVALSRSAALARLEKKSSPNMPLSATPTNPPPSSQRNSRRVRRQNCFAPTSTSAMCSIRSIEEDEFVQVEHEQAYGLHRGLVR